MLLNFGPGKPGNAAAAQDTDKLRELRSLREKYPEFSPFILLKLSLVRYGAVLTEAAAERVSRPDMAFYPSDAFGLRYGTGKKSYIMPAPIELRDSTFVYINYGEDYPDAYTVEYDPDSDRFYLTDSGIVLDEIGFVAPAELIHRTTSAGTPMSSLADLRSQKLILTSYRRCEFWRQAQQCHFCAFFTAGKADPELSTQDARELVSAALEEPGRFSELYISGGTDFSGDPMFSNEIRRYIRILQEIGSLFNGRYPSQLMAPAYPKQQLQALYRETGVTSYSADIELADPDIFRQYCPGKEGYVGHAEWIRRLMDSVEIFGRGNVYTQVVAGAELAGPAKLGSEAEAIESNLALCRRLAEHDVVFLSSIWRPHRASRLGIQPVPSMDYYVSLVSGIHEIRRAHRLFSADDDYKHCGNHADADLERTDYGVAAPGEELAVAAADVWSAPDGLLHVGLRTEKTSAGSTMTDALWFGRNLRILLTDGRCAWRLEAEVRYIRIAGKDFRAALDRIRSRDPKDDLSALYVLAPTRTPKPLAPEESAAVIRGLADDAGFAPVPFFEKHLDRMKK